MTLKQKIGTFVIKLFPGTRENFNIFRYELNAFFLRLKNKTFPLKINEINKYTAGDSLSVNFGAGPFGETGWVNIDMFKMKNISFTYDCRRNIPFKDNTISRIRCEHMLEHLDRMDEAPLFLKECFRCMKVGAVLRIIVPDLVLFVRAAYLDTEESWSIIGIDKKQLNRSWHTGDILNHVFRQNGEHKFAYDFCTLSKTLNDAGFLKIEKCSFMQTMDPLLAKDQPNHQHYSLYVECIKEKL